MLDEAAKDELHRHRLEDKEKDEQSQQLDEYFAGQCRNLLLSSGCAPLRCKTCASSNADEALASKAQQVTLESDSHSPLGISKR